MELIILIIIVILLNILYKLYINKDKPDKLYIGEDLYKDYVRNYPNGWLPVLASNQLKRGQIIPVYGFGYDMVVFRGYSGKVYVLDAYCPHLGANIGIGGTVVGEDIKCPLHGWTFNNEGKCTTVPGIEAVNSPKAEIKVWESLEVNGFIFVWNHSNGEKPNWVIEPIQGIDENNYLGQYIDEIITHFREILENSPDSFHFVCVHLPKPDQIIANKDEYKLKWCLFNYVKIEFIFNWNIKSKAHICQTILTFKLLFKSIDILNSRFIIDMIGPAHIHAISEINGKVLMQMSLGMISHRPYESRFIHQFYNSPEHGGFLSYIFKRIVLKNIMTILIGLAIKQDRDIWENRKYLAKPHYCKYEQIKEFRKWFKQFY